MSVCGQGEEESASEEPGPRLEPYDQKGASKVVRVLTVLAYLLSVSLAAILLSVYYVCVWKSPDLPPQGNGTSEGPMAARQADPHLYNATEAPIKQDFTGGTGGPINETTFSPASSNTPSETTDTGDTDTEPTFLDTTGSTSYPDNGTNVIGPTNFSVT